MKSCGCKFLYHLSKVYWKVVRPKTYGVKGVILNPLLDRRILLIRNTYGDRMLWNLPGGGYSPTRESAESAIRRELREELCVNPVSVRVLGEYLTAAEGKRDTVTIYLCQITSDVVDANCEISEFKWVSIDGHAKLPNTARVASHGIQLYRRLLGLK